MGERELDVRLADGRVIRLRHLEQWRVYEGLVDVPTRGRNARLVAAVVDGASADGRRVVLVPPVEAPVVGPHRGGPGEACLLPRTAVCARFESAEPVTGSGDYSELTVVWFQEAWAPPVESGVAARLRTLDWDAHARDMVW